MGVGGRRQLFTLWDKINMRSLLAIAAAALVCATIELILAVVGNESPDLGFGVAYYAGVPLLLAWFCVFVWSIITMVRLLRLKRWAPAMLSPPIPVCTFISAYWALPYVQFPQDYNHFRAMRRVYDADVSRLPRDGHRFAEFNWGGITFSSKGVVYDETDEVGLPYGHQSADWKRRMGSTDLTCGGDGPVGEVLPLGQHYYVVAFGC